MARRHAMDQSAHEAWNAKHYPGTLQLCSVCDEPTGRCEEDAMWTDDGEPLCESCYKVSEPTERKTNEPTIQEGKDPAATG